MATPPNIAAPNLPTPPAEPDQRWTTQLLSVLRLFFNQVTNALNLYLRYIGISSTSITVGLPITLTAPVVVNENGALASTVTLNGGGLSSLFMKSAYASGYTGWRIYNDQNSNVRALECDYSGSTYGGPLLTGGPTGEAAALYTTGPYPLSIGTNVTEAIRISAAGNAVFNAPSSGAHTINGQASIVTLNGVAAANSYITWQTATVVKGYIGTDGGAIIGGGTGTSFGFRSEVDAIIISGAGSFTIRYSSTGNLSVPAPGSGSHAINGAVTFPTVSTTASAANAFLDNAASNNLLRSTSSIRYKTNVMDLSPDFQHTLDTLRAITYTSKAEADDPTKVHYGLIAEEVDQVDGKLVHYTKNELGELIPDGVQYDRLVVLLLKKIQLMDIEIKVLRDSIKSNSEG